MDIDNVLRKIFPQDSASFSGRSGTEVNGLPKNTVPANCEIVYSGLKDSPITKRQEHYLVKVDDAMVFLRVCTAHETSDYAEFAVIREVAVSAEAQEKLQAYAYSSIEAICGEVKVGAANHGYGESSSFDM